MTSKLLEMNIDFPLEVRNRFRYLTDEYGFREVNEYGGGRAWLQRVTYVGDNVKVEIYKEVDMHTVGITLEDLRATDAQTFEFATYLKLVDRELAATFGYSVPGNKSELIELLDRYSEALKLVGDPLLRGDASTFGRFREALKTGQGLDPITGSMRFT